MSNTAKPAVKTKPDGYQNVVPYLHVPDARKEIAFMAAVFGGVEIERFETPDGKIKHAEVRIGDSVVMLSDARGVADGASALYVYVDDTDGAYRRAMDLGATSELEPADQFYGDRNAGVKSANGVTWWIGTHVEDVSPDEMKRRSDAAQKK